jgi:hypothetical protein
MASLEDSPEQMRHSKDNFFGNKNIGGFEVICGGKAVCPKSWGASVFSWILILLPSAL